MLKSAGSLNRRSFISIWQICEEVTRTLESGLSGGYNDTSNHTAVREGYAMKVERIYSRYKVQTVGNTIFDPIRQKYLRITPEEIIRQKTIKFLMKSLGVPQSRIIIERSLGTLGVEGSKKRIDIGILADNESLIGIIECKASLVQNNEAAYIQAQDYLLALNVKYFFVTDGCVFNGYFRDTTQFVQLEEIPQYSIWSTFKI